LHHAYFVASIRSPIDSLVAVAPPWLLDRTRPLLHQVVALKRVALHAGLLTVQRLECALALLA